MIKVDIKTVTYTRRSACLEQIEAAIDLYRKENWAAATTLFCTAEGMLPDIQTDDYLFEGYMGAAQGRGVPYKTAAGWINEFRNWLKHNDGMPDTRDITLFECQVTAARALSKFHAEHQRYGSKKLDDFEKELKTAMSL